MPGSPVLRYLPECAQIHVHWVSDTYYSTISSSATPFSSCPPSSPASVFSSESALYISSVQFSHSVVSDSLRPHGLQHARPPCPITNSRSPLKLTSIESVMPSNHHILCHSLLLLPSIFPSIRVFSNESALCITWPNSETQIFGTLFLHSCETESVNNYLGYPVPLSLILLLSAFTQNNCNAIIFLEWSIDSSISFPG